MLAHGSPSAPSRTLDSALAQCSALCALLTLCACGAPTAPTDGGPDALDASDAANASDASDAFTIRDAPPLEGGTPACGSYEGSPSWTARLTVEPDARLCAYPLREWLQQSDETREQAVTRSLREMITRKSVITVAPGTWGLPTMSESRAFLLPLCVADVGSAGPSLTAAPQVTVRQIEGGIGTVDGIFVEATFGLGTESLSVTIPRPLSSPTQAVFSSTPQTLHQNAITARRGERLYASCAIAANSCRTLAVAGLGSLRFDEYHWASSPGLGLAIPVRLRGSIDGATIDVRAYESMTGVYSHHAFDRVYLVRFASPLRGACGLRIDSSIDGTVSVGLATCDGTPMGTPTAATVTDAACD